MSITRFNALNTIENRPDPLFFDTGESEFDTIASYFGENVFGEDAMKKYDSRLPPSWLHRIHFYSIQYP
jgi:hypothetical protein